MTKYIAIELGVNEECKEEYMLAAEDANSVEGISAGDVYGIPCIHLHEDDKISIEKINQKLNSICDETYTPINAFLLRRLIINIDIEMIPQISDCLRLLNEISPYLYGEYALERMLDYRDCIFGYTQFREHHFHNREFKITFYHKNLPDGTEDTSFVRCTFYASRVFKTSESISGEYLTKQKFWNFLYKDLKRQWTSLLGKREGLEPLVESVFNKLKAMFPDE